MSVGVLGKIKQPAVNGFACRCGGVVLFKIGVMGLLSWVMGLLIGVVAWLSARSERWVFRSALWHGCQRDWWWFFLWFLRWVSLGGCWHRFLLEILAVVAFLWFFIFIFLRNFCGCC